MRGKGMAGTALNVRNLTAEKSDRFFVSVHILISNCAGFINTFANSVGLANIGWRYYFVYVIFVYSHVSSALEF